MVVQQKIEVAGEIARAAPPVAVVGASIAGVPMNTIVLVLTMIYLVLQIAFLLYKWVRAMRGKDVEQ